MVIIGAGGHARSVIACALKESICVSAVYDFTFEHPGIPQEVLGVPIRGGIDGARDENEVLIALGCNYKRKIIASTLLSSSHSKFISERAEISPFITKIDSLCCIMPLSYVGPNVSVGKGTIINTSSVVEHDCQIGSFSHVSIGALLAGSVKIGNECVVGAGATVIDKVAVCDNTIIGAGAVVVSDILVPGTYVGCPARIIDKHSK